MPVYVCVCVCMCVHVGVQTKKNFCVYVCMCVYTCGGGAMNLKYYRLTN